MLLNRTLFIESWKLLHGILHSLYQLRPFKSNVREKIPSPGTGRKFIYCEKKDDSGNKSDDRRALVLKIILHYVPSNRVWVWCTLEEVQTKPSTGHCFSSRFKRHAHLILKWVILQVKRIVERLYVKCLKWMETLSNAYSKKFCKYRTLALNIFPFVLLIELKILFDLTRA